MGTFVDKSGLIGIPLPPAGITDGNFAPTFAVNPTGPWGLVSERFDQSMATAELMLNKLIGGDGETGYLVELQNIIEEISTDTITDIAYTSVPIGTDVTTTVGDAPEFSGLIETDFGTFDAAAPGIIALPTVDLSDLMSADIPDELVSAISWFEQSYNTELYTPLFNRLISDLTSGASGIGGTVEQEIYDRALARQTIEEDKLQTEIEEYFSATGFDLPTGAMAARLLEHGNGRAMRALDLNGKIMIEQADLAQKNSQFVIEAARGLEAILRDDNAKKNDRSLDYSKAVAANAVTIYAENIKRFIAILEANKNYVELQVANLRAVVESNKGMIEVYAAEAQVFSISVDAKAKKNTALTDIYKAEIAGYDSETKAISENQKNIIAAYELKISNASKELEAAIASADGALRGYGTEYSLREKVAEAMANVAMQSMASAYGAVNSSAGLSYSAGESVSESWGHSEGRTESFTHGESISAYASLSNNLTETHSYKE